MLLVGDGGSTKADWWFVQDSKPSSITTMGFNPLFHDSDSVLNGLRQSEELIELAPHISQVYFYGASCSNKTRNAVLEHAFNSFFKQATSVVDHDLMGAAIATSNDAPGIVCILGTGSNGAYYDGSGFPNRVPALGYVLGDEGSGAYIGKKLLADFLYNLVPQEISDYLSKELKLEKDFVFENVYQKNHANRYLAGFAKELSGFVHLEYTQALITDSFDDFIKYHVLCYPQSKKELVHFVGSIAHYFKSFIEKALLRNNLSLGNVIAKPGRAILEYYLNKS